MRTCVALFTLVACASAVTRDQFYPFGAGLDQRLPRGAEVSSPETQLKVPIIFYGETYESIFVNNFGVLSFRADIPGFFNAEFPLPLPSIAAFYTNVDTSESGAVYYRETDEPHVLLKAEESVQNNFHEYFDFQPKSVFVTTWVEVTYNGNKRPDHTNTFQIAVISNGTESFVEFLYPEREIHWIQREVQSTSLPDAKAQAGFIAEDGRLFSLRGSGSHQIRNIVSWSNTHEPGKYVFRVGNIPPDGNIAVPDQYNQSEVEVEEESKTCAQSGPSVCHIQARCVDYQSGICCQCSEGFYGNGKSCIKDDVPLRVHGKVNGVINDQYLDDIDIQAYVVVADGRSYTALSQAPPKLGSSLQLLSVLGGVIGWLFAKPNGNAKNGYQLTGSMFNHTADVFFPTTGERVTINQEFLGHDVFDQITVDSDVRGTLPVLPGVAKLEIDEHEEQYTLVEPGLIRSESSRTYTNKLTGEKYEQRVSQTITFNYCRYAPVLEEDSVPQTLKVLKNYLGYENKDNIIRYGMSNKIIPLGQEDPCIEGRNTCGPHSNCVVQGNSFACVCQAGFTNVYQNGPNTCIDIDECSTGTNNCDGNAECYNHDGGFQCRCKPGYEGNGVTCNRVSRCREKTCDPNADCFEDLAEARCMCKPGYTGDGTRCWTINEFTCDVRHNCSPYATCVFSETTNSYNCQCNPGYNGNGYYCAEEAPVRPTPPSTTPYTSINEYTTTQATPDEAEYNQNYFLPTCDPYGVCYCPAGYSSYRDDRGNDLCRINNYDNQSQLPPPQEPEPPVDQPENNETSLTCYSDADCPPNALCSVPSDQYSASGHCVCPEGYEGDGYECIEKTGVSCSCGPNAHCIENAAGELMCICASGYHGDGYSCRPNFSCNNNSDCEANAECRPDETSREYVCQCIEGYIKDANYACIPDGQQCNGAVCAEHASCLYDETIGVSYCHCDNGYEGEGVSECVPQGSTCDVANDCSPDATCTPYDQTYQCVCREGYTGDGYSCTPDQNCKTNPYLCDVHASCLKRNDAYVCVCNADYNGDGATCQLNPRQAGNFLVASDGVFVYRVPFQVNIATPINNAIDQIAVGIDVDCQTGKIYWGDVVSNTIKRASYDGSGFELFVPSGVKSPEGISVDWSSRNIFWTDSKKLTIEVANLETKVRKTLFAIDGISNPRGIAVHPQLGKIFWSDWNRAGPKIEWANMDGSQRGVFLDSADVKLPNSLAIDWPRDRLCYADAGLSSIKCVSIQTGEKETIAANCTYPFGLAINGDTFYWTDWKTLKIEYIDTLTQQKGQLPIVTASRRLYGVAVAPEQCPSITNVCAIRNGNCGPEQLCLPTGYGTRTCVDGDTSYTPY